MLVYLLVILMVLNMLKLCFEKLAQTVIEGSIVLKQVEIINIDVEYILILHKHLPSCSIAGKQLTCL